MIQNRKRICVESIFFWEMYHSDSLCRLTTLNLLYQVGYSSDICLRWYVLYSSPYETTREKNCVPIANFMIGAASLRQMVYND